MRAHSHQRQGGFTLMEVIIAMMILSVSMVAIMQLFGQGAAMTAAAEETTLATLLARSKISEVLMTEQLEEESDSGRFEEFDGRFSYEVTIEEYELEYLNEDEELDFGTVSAAPADKEPTYKTFRIEVKVTWNDDRKALVVESLRTDYELPESQNK